MNIGDTIETREQSDALPVGTVAIYSSGVAYTKAVPKDTWYRLGDWVRFKVLDIPNKTA